MKSSIQSPWWCRTILLAASLLLMFTAFFKFQALGQFAQSLREHALVPASLTAAMAWFVPGVELFLGVFGFFAVLTSRGLAITSLGASALFMVLTFYAVLLMHYPPSKPSGCGCGLSAGPADWERIAMMNAGGAAVLAIVAWRTASPRAARASGPDTGDQICQ